MINLRRKLLGLGVVAASSLFAISAAHALNGPSAIQIDGGPLGPLEISGGLDGYGFVQSGASTNSLLGTDRTVGVNVGSALIELQNHGDIDTIISKFCPSLTQWIVPVWFITPFTSVS